jgi:hypothetical protein
VLIPTESLENINSGDDGGVGKLTEMVRALTDQVSTLEQRGEARNAEVQAAMKSMTAKMESVLGSGGSKSAASVEAQLDKVGSIIHNFAYTHLRARNMKCSNLRLLQHLLARHAALPCRLCTTEFSSQDMHATARQTLT